MSAALRASIAEQMVRVRGEVPDAFLDVVVEHVDGLWRARPRSFDAVREAEALAGPGRPTPYWASVWPSGTALTRAVLTSPPRPGARVLELGCGLAMPSVAAARAGARVLALDLCPEATVYAAHNLALNDTTGDVAAADWRDLPLLDGPQWDLVLGADVLYRRENHESLLRLLPELVRPGGAVWIADPGRAGCREFLAGARRFWSLGWTKDGDVTVHRLRRVRPVPDAQVRVRYL